jgi:quinol monooxygenase YgiN
MLVLRTTFKTKPEHQRDLLEALLSAASSCAANKTECLRFEVFQDEGDPNHISLEEVFPDDNAVKEFLQGPHMTSWRQKYSNFGDWSAQDSFKIRLTNVSPLAEA